MSSSDEPIPGLVYTFTGPAEPTALPLFESADLDASRCVVFLPGLFDGWQTVPYVGPLRAALKQHGWSLAQPHLPSSYKGFGLASLERDGELISQAVDHLRSRRGKTTVVLMGHSTGCQQIMHYLVVPARAVATTTGGGGNGGGPPERAKVDKAILQAPASDRPAASSPSLVARIQALYTAALARGGLTAAQAELCPSDIADEFQLEAITVYRAWSLFCIGGDDDFFSRDIPSSSSSDDNDEGLAPVSAAAGGADGNSNSSDHPPSSSASSAAAAAVAGHRPLSQTFGRLPLSATAVLGLCSAEDECVPSAGSIQPVLLARWSAAAAAGAASGGESGGGGGGEVAGPFFQGEMVQGAGHNVSDATAQTTLIGKVLDFIGR